ncbi:beta-ketoacyl-ACP synthase 3 [Streptomyces sp. NPDC001744]|uniref:beta-ketoacyl-ACP synthase 3 n=1 Tax=Streptomyces sp. NPDC001744 TaxID=3364606 RepID=UPI0036794606
MEQRPGKREERKVTESGHRRTAVAESGSPATGARIAGLGAYRPQTVVSNEQAAADAGVAPEWIAQRVGIHERRRATGSETVVGMAVEAAREALDAAGKDANDVDVVILATCSLPTAMPNGAARVAAGLGCRAAAGFDLNAACAGFNHALAVADGLVRSAVARNVLVVGAERMTDWVSAHDRDTGPIFADGAAAALVVPAIRPGIFPVAWGGDGERADLIRIRADTGRMEMAGREVFAWAVTALTPVIRAACERAGFEPGELKGFVPHQANLRIVKALGAAVGAAGSVTATDVTHTGNTCGASVPLALHALRQRGELTAGDPVLLLGFGAGLSYAAQVVLSP